MTSFSHCEDWITTSLFRPPSGPHMEAAFLCVLTTKDFNARIDSYRLPVTSRIADTYLLCIPVIDFNAGVGRYRSRILYVDTVVS
jgi:hypothetical protein